MFNLMNDGASGPTSRASREPGFYSEQGQPSSLKETYPFPADDLKKIFF